ALDVGEHHQPVGGERLGEEAGGEVLVDDGFDAGQPSVPAHDRYAPASGADDDLAGGEQPLDRGELDDLARLRRRDHAPHVRPVGGDGPAALGCEPGRLDAVVDRADRLRRPREGRVVLVDDDLGEHGDDAAAAGSSRERLREEVADHPLALRAEDVERVRRDLGVGVGLEREESHLRAVAVRDHELVPLGERRQRRDCLADVGLLDGGLRALPAPQERIPSQGDDEPHRQPVMTASGWRPIACVTIGSSTSASVGVPTSSRSWRTCRIGWREAISLDRSIGVPETTTSHSAAFTVSSSSCSWASEYPIAGTTLWSCGHLAKTCFSEPTAYGRGSTILAAPAFRAATRPAPNGISPWVRVGPSSTTRTRMPVRSGPGSRI